MVNNNIILSVSDLVLQKENKEIALNRIFDLGVGCIEITMDGEIWSKYKKASLSVKKTIEKLKIPTTIHPPVWDVNLASENSVIRKAAIKVHLKAFYLASTINSNYVVLHPGFIRSDSYEIKQALKRAKITTEKLINIAGSLNLPIAVENVGYHGSSLFTMEEYVDFVSSFNNNNKVGYLIDTGHANLNNWDIVALLDIIGNKLFGMHIHNNNGKKDEHLPIGDGLIEWSKIWDKIKNINFDHKVYITLEYASGVSIDRLKEDLKSISEIIY